MTISLFPLEFPMENMSYMRMLASDTPISIPGPTVLAAGEAIASCHFEASEPFEITEQCEELLDLSSDTRSNNFHFRNFISFYFLFILFMKIFKINTRKTHYLSGHSHFPLLERKNEPSKEKKPHHSGPFKIAYMQDQRERGITFAKRKKTLRQKVVV